MKTIGLLGGTSPESTVFYYNLLNQEVRERLGGANSAKCIFLSVNWEEVKTAQFEDRWQDLDALFAANTRSLVNAGVDVILIGANTMHKCLDAVLRAATVPVLSVVDVVADSCKAHGYTKIGLLGTRFTMADGFYQRLLAKHNIEAIIPQGQDFDYIHDSIYNELTRGIFKPETKERYKQVMLALQSQGAQCIVSACTEIGLLILPEECPLPTLDSTILHAKAAVDFALSA